MVLVIAIVMTFCVAALAPATGRAAPDDPPGAAPNGPALTLDSLGFGPSLGFYGLQAEQTLTIPVPVGLGPVALTGRVDLPPFIQRGSITVIQDDRTISRVELPADQAPLTIPLAGARVVGNAVAFRLHVNLVPVPESCVYDPSNPLRLNDMVIAFDGAESPPATIAEFLPPVLQKLTIFIPGAPSAVESDAALKLTTSIVAHYGRQDIRVTVRALDGATTPPAPSAPFERQIVVRESPDAKVSLQPAPGMPVLLVTGPHGAIANQVRLLTSDLSRLALSSNAIAGALVPTPQLPRNVLPIRDLGQPGVNSTAMTHPRVTIPLDQTRLGRPVHGVRVHLQGSYTPLPNTVGGQVVVSVDGNTVARWPVESTGSIDRWVNVPDDALHRNTNFDVAIDAAGNTGRCGEFQPITLTIDGASEVQSQLADPPSPVGFQALPQALMPRVLVGMNGQNAFTDTVRAVTIMEGLQHLSDRPLAADVVPFTEAAGAQLPAVLISAGGWDQGDITLPVAAGADGLLTVAGSNGDGAAATLTLDPAQPFGSLQVVYQNGRTLLAATSNNDAAQLDSLLSWLGEDVRHWSGLDGTAVIAMPGHPPVTVQTDQAQSAAAESGGLPAWLPWLGGAAVLAVVVAIGFAIGNRKRKTAG